MHLGASMKVIQRREDERLERTFHEGELTVIPKGMHSTCTTRGDTSFLHLYFEEGFSRELDNDLPHRIAFEDRRISKLLRMLQVNAQVPGPETPLLFESSAVEIWSLLLRKSPPVVKTSLCPRALARAKELMHESISGHLSLASLAGATGLSSRHFTRLFRRATGRSPYQYLLEIRIERAKALLERPEMRIIDVAAAVGYTNPSHFTDAFTKITSVSPSSYRAARALQVPERTAAFVAARP
jgi:AraC family transcriptional regulator